MENVLREMLWQKHGELTKNHQFHTKTKKSSKKRYNKEAIKELSRQNFDEKSTKRKPVCVHLFPTDIKLNVCKTRVS